MYPQFFWAFTVSKLCAKVAFTVSLFCTFVGVGVNMSKSAVSVSVLVSVSKFALLVSVRFRLRFYLGVTEYQPTIFFSVFFCHLKLVCFI